MQDVIENNKLIARFMGGKFRGDSRLEIALQNVWLPIHGLCRWDTVEPGKGAILWYHKSWDWLIPVVEEISTLKGFTEVDLNILDLKINAKIDDVYSAAVQFIKYWNEEPQTESATGL